MFPGGRAQARPTLTPGSRLATRTVLDVQSAGDSESGVARARDADATKQAILDATLHIMESGGESRVRVATVAREAGVSTGAIYAHFIDREALVGAAHIEYMRRAVESLFGSREPIAVSDVDDPSLSPQMKSYMRATLETTELAERRRWAEAAIAGHRFEQTRPAMRAVIDLFIAESSGPIIEAQRLGWVDAALDPRAIALLQLATVVGLSLFADLVTNGDEFTDALVEVWSRLPSSTHPDWAEAIGQRRPHVPTPPAD